MPDSMSSRERMIAAIDCEKVDHIPLAFMLFGALNGRLGRGRRNTDRAAPIAMQLELGLDTVVDLTFFAPQAREVGHDDAPGLPVRFGAGVSTRQWIEPAAGDEAALMHKAYQTPAGTASVAVRRSDDWPYGDDVPFMDDYLAPRCARHLVEDRADLAALRHLLAPPTAADLADCRRAWDEGRALADRHGLLLAGGWGVGGDALAWFCGLDRAVYMAIDDPQFLDEIRRLVHAWNLPRMSAFLDYGVDLFIRRAWYEGTDFWSPQLFREFSYPIIKEEVELAHQAGARYGYLLTSGITPLLDMLMELDIDVLIGPDPVQGRDSDLAAIGAALRGKVSTWGGINGFVTVERGTHGEIDRALREAIEHLGPDGLILSPVDNVRDTSDAVWQNVEHLIATWRTGW